MSMCRSLCFAVVLFLSTWHVAYGQSEQLPKAESANAADEPQIALRFKFFELNDNRATRSAFAELTDKQADSDSAETTDGSQDINEIVQSTEQLTHFLDDLCKVSNGKVLSESQMLMNPGIQTRYQNGKEMDFTQRPPKLIRLIEVSESVDPDAASVDAVSTGSSQLIGTTILATGTIGANQSVTLNLIAEYAEIDNSRKTTFAALKAHSNAVNVVLEEEQSFMLGPWPSRRMEERTEKMPVLGRLPGIGSAFGRKISTARSTIVLVLATTEIVAP